MEESERNLRKRKRPSKTETSETHHGHRSSHRDKSKSRHNDLHNQDLRFSSDSHRFSRVSTAFRARRQDDGTSTVVNVELSVSIATTTPLPNSVIPAMPQTLSIDRNPPNIGLNTETTFQSSQPVVTPLSTMKSASPSGDRSSATPSEESNASRIVGIASTTVSSLTTSHASSHTSSRETLQLSNNSTMSATTMSSHMNTTSASSSSPSTGTLNSVSLSNNASDTRSGPTSMREPTSTSDGEPLVPVFTTAMRIGIPISSGGSLVGTSFVTSFSTSYATRSPSSSAAASSRTIEASTTGTDTIVIASLTQSGSPDATGTSPSGNLTSNADSNGSSVPTPTVVGGVVGGVAGLTVVLLLALVLLRWYKRRRGGSIQGIDDGDPSRPGTSTTAGSAAAAGVGGAAAAMGGFGLLKRLSRRVGPAPSQPPPAPLMTEIGAGVSSFQRIGGRKLPSQFSPGVEGPGPSYPSGSSHYPSGGTYASSAMTADNPFADPNTYTPSPAATTFADAGAAGAGGLSGLAGARQEPASQAEQDGLIQPGPARTPEVHQGESFRTSSHLASDWPLRSSPPLRTPSPGLEQHPALRPGGVPSASPPGAAHSLFALQPGSRGAPEFRRGTPPARLNSRSRFVEDEM